MGREKPFMKVTLFIGATMLFFVPVAHANTMLPGLNEGPPGCGWRATVTDVHRGDDATIELVLTQMIGKCMFNPGPCGAKEDLLTAHVKKDDLRGYQPGQIVKIWVTGTTVAFETPMCTRTPGP